MRFLKLATLALLGKAAAEIRILTPPDEHAQGESVAIVWIHGADCDAGAYTEFANTIQTQAARDGKKVWVGIPQFFFDIPEPLLIDKYVNDTIAQLREAGFTGDNIMIAGHSLGGIMAQDYAGAHSNLIKGQFLMGSVLLRKHRSLNNVKGTTNFDYKVPTLTLGGTKDGLMRVSRLAESYWHQYKNIQPDQAGMFPIFALEGTSHMSYMTGDAPKAVKARDLVPDIDDALAKK